MNSPARLMAWTTALFLTGEPQSGDRVSPPPLPGEWDVKFGDSQAANGWDDLCSQAAGNTRSAWELMRTNPRPPEDKRHTRLRGRYATRTYGGRELEQWEIEVTSGGRIFYLVDDGKRTVWIVRAGTGHPKATE
jgi:hypothetical protein